MQLIITDDTGDNRLVEAELTEQELKDTLPEVYTRIMQVWKEISEEEESILDDPDELDMDMEWMGACSDGCHVEPDGRCSHGFYSLGIRMGLI
jgi:hypothetical protein